MSDGRRWGGALAALAGVGLGVIGLSFLLELRPASATRPLRDSWRTVPVRRRGGTELGISFRTPQAEAFGLNPGRALAAMLEYPFTVLRLGAYWDRIETAPGRYRVEELDAQLRAAERAGKRVVLGLGAVKNFGYPEFFVPGHHLPQPLPEGKLITPASHASLLAAAEDVLGFLVQRYRDREAITAWQVEHEAVDPLGAEHSWRLSEEFVRREVAIVRSLDPGRPVLLNGFLPTSRAVAAFQRWRTRGQGDSLDAAMRLADVVGVDYYPRHAVVGSSRWALYLDGRRSPLRPRRLERLFDWAARGGHRVIVAEGQAEPWEVVTVAPDPWDRTMRSCGPADVIRNYDDCLRAAHATGCNLGAYLFWGAEYWLRRAQGGDRSYLAAFERVLAES